MGTVREGHVIRVRGFARLTTYSVRGETIVITRKEVRNP